MVSLSSLGSSRHTIRSLRRRFLKIIQTKESAKIFRISLLDTKEILKWAVEADTASSQQVTGVVRVKLQRRILDSFASISAILDPPLLHETRTQQVCQVQKALTAVQAYAASDGRMS